MTWFDTLLVLIWVAVFVILLAPAALWAFRWADNLRAWAKAYRDGPDSAISKAEALDAGKVKP